MYVLHRLSYRGRIIIYEGAAIVAFVFGSAFYSTATESGSTEHITPQAFEIWYQATSKGGHSTN